MFKSKTFDNFEKGEVKEPVDYLSRIWKEKMTVYEEDYEHLLLSLN